VLRCNSRLDLGAGRFLEPAIFAGVDNRM